MADSFVWGGQTWGPGDLDAFINYLSSHGSDYSTWAANHEAAAAIFTGGSSSSADAPVPKSVGEALGDELDTGATAEEAAAAAAALAAAQQAQGFSEASGSDLVQEAEEVQQAESSGGDGGGSSGQQSSSTPPPPSVVQVVFSHDDLVSLWESAGGPAGAADIAAAIALAESNGCRYAHAGPSDDRPADQCTFNETDGENSYGLWQVNIEAHPGYDGQALYGASYNAAAAVAISDNGFDFTPWSTFTNGAFQKFLTGSPSTGATLGATPVTTADTVNQPAGVAAAWSNLIGQYATRMPAANTKVGALADSFTGIFGG
jgi:Lysozyme like domain